MALTTAAATAAATAAGFAYLDAKFHIQKDVHYLRGKRLGRQLWAQAVQQKRTSPYYFIEQNARAAPDCEALWSRDDCYTRRELYDRANQYGQWFLAQGVRPGDLVGFFMSNSPDFITAWLGLLAVGAAPAMLNHHLPAPALLHCRALSGATLVLYDGPADVRARLAAVAADLAAAGCRTVALDAVRADVYAQDPGRPGDELRAGVQALDPLALFYTSGTTGMPKACVVPVVVAFGHGVANATGLNPVHVPGQTQTQTQTPPRYYDCMPFYHGTGGINAMAQVLAGTTLCVGRKFSATHFWRDVRDARATWFVYVGETLRYLLAAPVPANEADDRRHDVYGIHGNGLRPDVWERFRERFGITCVTEFFHSTEGPFPLENACRGPFLAHAVGHHGLLRRWWHRDDFAAVEVDPATGALVRDEKRGRGAAGAAVRRPLTQGGEILVRQPPGGRPEHAFVGYYNDGPATEAKLVRDVFRKGDCWYRTGDALRRDADGRWFFLDRLGDTFRWKGENVATAAVAEVLGRFPGVQEANVYGVDLPGHDGKAGAAAVLLAKDGGGGGFDHAAFLQHCRKHLPKYAVPLFLRHVQQTVATHNNKQNKLPLKREGVDPDKTTNGDTLWWVADHGKGATYVPFTRADWEALQTGQARL